MRNSTRARTATTVTRLLTNARYEVLPTPTIADKVRDAVPTDVTITVTASPAKGLESTVALAEELAVAGYRVVPHLAARMVRDRAELLDLSQRLEAAGITSVFVPGGDAEEPGDYPDSLAMLEDLMRIEHRFTHIGVTGYPESHPTIADDLTVQAMWDKRRYATHIVSNLTFDPDVVRDWLSRVRRRGVKLPLLLGVPGPVDRAKLLGMATKIGVGDSTKFLMKQGGLMARLFAPGGFTGERFLEQCAARLGDPEMLVDGLHIYTFNQVAETEVWRREWLARLHG